MTTAPTVAEQEDRATLLVRLEDLKRLKLLKLERARRRLEESIRYYTPHSKQNGFHRDTSRIRLILGGNRSGKSESSMKEATAHALGYRPWLAEDDPSYRVPVQVPNRGLIVGESFGEQVKKVLVPKLLGDVEKGLPGSIPKKEFSTYKKNQAGVITTIYFSNGSRMDFQSYDQDVDLFESSDYDWCALDEPVPRPIWVAIMRGLTDRNAPVWMAMTPLKEAWIFDELVSKDHIGKHFFDIEDNLHFGLTREGIDNFSDLLTEDEREARLRGRFFHLTGLVYKTYGAVHRIPRQKLSPIWGMWMHIDTHARTPHHAVWGSILPDGSIWICGELKNSDETNRVEPFADAIKEYEQEILEWDSTDIVRLIDPTSSTPNPAKDGLSIKDSFSERGISCVPGSKNRDSGILRMQARLKHEPEKGQYPQIYFFSDLDGLHYEMTHYVWDDWQKHLHTKRTEKQVPRDKDDHFIEGVHRILLDDPMCPGWSGEDDASESGQGASRVTGY